MNTRTRASLLAAVTAAALAVGVPNGLAQAPAKEVRIAVLGDSISVSDTKQAEKHFVDFKLNDPGPWTWSRQLEQDDRFDVNDGMARGGWTAKMMADKKMRPMPDSDYLLIMFGTNEINNFKVGGPKPEEAYGHIKRLAEKSGLKKERIVLLSVAPFDKYPEDRNAYNQGLEGFAKAEGYRFIDGAKVLDDGQGRYAPKMGQSDGMHPTWAGQKKMGENINARMKELVDQDRKTAKPATPPAKPAPKTPAKPEK